MKIIYFANLQILQIDRRTPKNVVRLSSEYALSPRREAIFCIFENRRKIDDFILFFSSKVPAKSQNMHYSYGNTNNSIKDVKFLKFLFL